ncbi:L-threonylcarbamoyladenylate synthase [uncultured Desulfosarcina sp.]|uniref:L-threonylcarbamoyladenylate synthase n=1 Tax=uncultured Desulfosarcina sp. TaxID=218289 RepID=UPI0029C97E11|nr:L-threonylcarbamoyladenylate synthase [uncultured Desulfosarcina sp.]
MKRKLKNSHCIDRIVRINPSDPNKSDIQRAVGVLNRQGVLVFPTTGLYGLGADAFSPEAVSRVFAIKRRPQGMPLLVMVPDLDEMGQVVRRVPAFARPLMELWPGGITLIFEAGDGVPSVLTGGTGKIGIRIPAHPVAKDLVSKFGGPITATSANLSGGPAVSDLANLDPCIGGEVDLIVDAGVLAGGAGSTVLDATCRPPRMIREGAVSRQKIETVLRTRPV